MQQQSKDAYRDKNTFVKCSWGHRVMYMFPHILNVNSTFLPSTFVFDLLLYIYSSTIYFLL